MFNEKKFIDKVTYNKNINFNKILNLTIDHKIYSNKEKFLSINGFNRNNLVLFKTVKDSNINVNVYQINGNYYIEGKKNNIDSGIYISKANFDLISEKNILKTIASIIVVGIASIVIFNNYDFLKEYTHELNYRITTYYEEQTNGKLANLNDTKLSNIDSYLLNNDSFLSELQDSINTYNLLLKKFNIGNVNYRDYIENNKSKKDYFSINELENLDILYIIPSKIIHDRDKKNYEKIINNLGLDENKKYSYNDLKKYFSLLMDNEIGQYNEIDKRYYDIINSLSILPKKIINLYLLSEYDLLNQNKVFQDFNKEIGFNQFRNGITLNTDTSSKEIVGSNRFMTKSEAFSIFLNNNTGKYDDIVKYSDNQRLYNYYNDYLNSIGAKLSKIGFGVGKSTKNTNVFNLGFYNDSIVDNLNSVEYLILLKKIKEADVKLFEKYKNIAGLNNKLLINSINLLGKENGYNQEGVKLYMEVFNLNKKEFYESINIGYNIKIDQYLQEIFRGEDINKKTLKTYDIVNDKLVNFGNILISDSKHNHKLIHELTHYFLEIKKTDDFKSQEFSISEYFKNRNKNGDDNTIFYGENWNDVFKYMYLEELNNSEGFVKRFGFSEYSLNQDKIGNTGNEILTELVRNFLQSPGYYAYLDLYGGDYAIHIRKSIPLVINFLEQYGIFTQQDYEFYKGQAREMKINIDTKSDYKVKDL